MRASMHLVKSRTLLACAKEESEYRVRHPENSSPNARVLVLGGTGRVGGSTAIALSNLRPDLRIIVAGRNRWMNYKTNYSLSRFLLVSRENLLKGKKTNGKHCYAFVFFCFVQLDKAWNFLHIFQEKKKLLLWCHLSILSPEIFTVIYYYFQVQNFMEIDTYDREKGASMVATLGGNSQFAEVDIENVKSLEAALKGMSEWQTIPNKNTS